MANIVALNTQDHRALCVDTAPSARYGDDKRFVLADVGRSSPIRRRTIRSFFSKDAETGAFYCGAMLGIG